MINYEEANIDQVSIHRIGDKTENEGVIHTLEPIQITDERTTAALMKFCCSAFKTPEFFHFNRSLQELSDNVLEKISKEIFVNPDQVHEQSKLIANHLYEYSNHPKIKPGDLICCSVRNLLIDDELVDAIGIYKIESLDTFIQLNFDANAYGLKIKQGIPLDKMEKGCLIFDTEQTQGYKVAIIDKNSSSSEAEYWKMDFLNLSQRSDNFHHTKGFIQATQAFVEDKMAEGKEIDALAKAKIMDKSEDYFKHGEAFDLDNYGKALFGENQMQDDFEDFTQDFQRKREVKLPSQFDISPAAVKTQNKVFKSVLKLDKNFHVYIHGDRSKIEKGTDANGNKFYKIYFDEER